MGLYKRGKTWYARIEVDGQKVNRSTRKTKRTDAEKVHDEILRGLLAGTYQKRAKVIRRPLFVVIESYLQDREARGKRTDSYRKLGDWNEALGDRDVVSITLPEIEAQLRRWMTDRG